MRTSVFQRSLLLSVLHFGLLFPGGMVSAQTALADSLRARLRTEGRTTTRVDLLIGLAVQVKDDSTSDRLLDESQTLAAELGYVQGLAYGPGIAARRFLREKNYPQALAAYKECIAKMDSLRMPQGYNSALSSIRMVYNSTGEQEERRVFYEQALQRYARMGLRLNVGVCHHGLGGYYLITNQYALSVEHYLKAREIYLELEPGSASNETKVVGQAYLQWGNLDRAEELLQMAVKAFEHEKNNYEAGATMIGLGDVELQRGDTLKARMYFRNALSLITADEQGFRGVVLTRIIQTSIWTGELDSARVQLDRLNTQHASEPLPFSSTNGECEVDYCNYLYWSRVGDGPAAQRYLENALQEAFRSTNLVMVLKYRKELAKLYRSHGDAVEAAEHALAYMHLNDSLQAVSDRGSIAAYEGVVQERESALEIERQKASLQQEQRRLRQQRIISFSIAGGLLLLVALAFSVYRGKKRSDELLLNILPEEVASELKAKGHADAKHFDQATILFTDFKGFTEASEKLSPQELVEELNTCFKAFDHIITARGIEKIKTIGDAYMCAGGLPDPKTSSPAAVVHAALEMQAFMTGRKAERDAQNKPAFEMRVGIHTGPVVAGIVGVKKFQYDIWGDTVNTASRMESSGEVGLVNISESTYALVKDAIIGEDGVASTYRVDRNNDGSGTTANARHVFTFTPRGKVQAKGKGEMEMYFVRYS